MRETEQLTFSFYFNCHLLLILAFLQNLAVRELRTRKTKLPAVEKKKPYGTARKESSSEPQRQWQIAESNRR